MTTSATLSIKESKRREAILNGPLWKTVFWLTTPLAVYALFNYLYGFIDFLLVSSIGSGDVATVYFIEDIKGAIMAIGGGIAIGGAVFVARQFGAGNLESARKHAGQTFTLAIIMSAVVAGIMMLLAMPILKLLNAPEEIIEKGLGFYLVQMASTVIIAVNGVFMAIERSKGNTTKVMTLNIIAIIVKVILSVLFVLVFSWGTLSIAYATVIAQAFLMVMGLWVLFNPKNSVSIRAKDLVPDYPMMKAIMIVALPVIGGKFLFSLGRVIVNGLAAVYGTTALAAFGLASKLIGGPGAMALIFEETTASIASQNIGARKIKRAFQSYFYANIQALIVGIIGLIIVMIFLDQMIPWFTANSSPEFASLAKQIVAFERFSVLSGATIGVVAGLFIGFRNTKMTLILNVIRVYVFRIPALILFLSLDVGPIALGYIMFISNTGTALTALVLVYLFYRRTKSYGYLDLRYEN